MTKYVVKIEGITERDSDEKQTLENLGFLTESALKIEVTSIEVQNPETGHSVGRRQAKVR